MLLTPAGMAVTDQTVSDQTVSDAGTWSARALVVPMLALLADLVLTVDWPVIATLDRPALAVAGIAAYLALGATALCWRAVRPVPVYAAVLAWATVAYVLLPVSPLVTVLVALYAVASCADGRPAAIVLAVVPVPLTLYALVQVAQPSGASAGAVFGFSTAFYALASGAVWLLARQAHRREGRVGELEAQREELARAAVAAERRRLARELHDIVSHAVSVMVLQAAGARRLVPAGEVAGALDDIETQGRQAMTELRRLLGVLRASERVAGEDGDAGGGARPGLADVAALARTIGATGVAVEVVTTGEPRPLDPSIDLTAYRVVQEALTNTAKHAGAGTGVVVAVDWGDELVIDVRETGGGVAVDSAADLDTGTGLIGMRERVHDLGGRLAAGPGGDGAYRVHAVLPVSAPLTAP
jgi:signal transduction histidine kinase